MSLMPYGAIRTQLDILMYSIPNALVYHSKYTFQILWKNKGSDILFKAS